MVATTIKKGYKQTESGVIPIDWRVSRIGDVLKVKHGKSQKDIEDINGIYPILATGGEIGRTNSFLSNKPSVMIGRKGTIDKPKYIDTPFWTVDTLFYTDIFNNAIPKYIFYKFNTIDWYLYNEASGVPSLNAKTIENIKIVIPDDINEQVVIATTLSDADTLIDHLDKLITKKKAIKQGTMQQLLTGKKRLPGFTGEWEEKKLGEIADIYQPETISQDNFSSDGYTVYGANGVIGKYKKYNHEQWQTIITCRGSTCGTVNKTTEKCWITGNAMVMNIDKNNYFDKLFFYFLLSSQDFKNCITGSGQPQIVRNPLYEFLVYTPVDKSEQTAIATILSDMDKEIELLEQKRDKYIMLKSGMMQQLLTGTIRIYGNK